MAARAADLALQSYHSWPAMWRLGLQKGFGGTQNHERGTRPFASCRELSFWRSAILEEEILSFFFVRAEGREDSLCSWSPLWPSRTTIEEMWPSRTTTEEMWPGVVSRNES
jgi:hypothetical protein